MFRLTCLLLAAGIANGVNAMPADTIPARTISGDATVLTVAAEAEASQAPDVAQLSAGVVAHATDASAAMQANSKQMARVIAKIKAAGIADKDIQTLGIDLEPQYGDGRNDNQPPKVVGYQAGNTVQIKIRDINQIGRLIDALVISGANQINGPQFSIDQPDALSNQARRQALDKARARAQMYASALGLKVRRIISVSETGSDALPQLRMLASNKMEAVATTMAAPVELGENTVNVSLVVAFELGR